MVAACRVCPDPRTETLAEFREDEGIAGSSSLGRRLANGLSTPTLPFVTRLRSVGVTETRPFSSGASEVELDATGGERVERGLAGGILLKGSKGGGDLLPFLVNSNDDEGTYPGGIVGTGGCELGMGKGRCDEGLVGLVTGFGMSARSAEDECSAHCLIP